MKKLLVLMLLVLAFVACEESTVYDAPSTDVKEVADKANNVTDTVEKTADLKTSARDRIESICELEAEFKAVYEVTSEYQGEVQSAEQEIAVKGDNYKQAIETDAMYFIDGVIYDCRNNEEWECYYLPQPEDYEAPETDCEVPENVSIKREFSKEVMGESTTCFEFSTKGVDATEINCYDEEGVLMYALQETPDLRVERTAVSVFRTVSDDEFELPAVAEELSLEDLQNAQPR